MTGEKYKLEDMRRLEKEEKIAEAVVYVANEFSKLRNDINRISKESKNEIKEAIQSAKNNIN